MTTIYLYIKTHHVKTSKGVTLKYFGKTSKDPFTYLGSGKDWLRHLREHGKGMDTEVYAQFDDEKETELLKETALRFSKEHDIVGSNEWANLQPENGIDGGNNNENLLTGQAVIDLLKSRGEYEAYCENMSTKMKEYIATHGNPFQGKTHSDETKRTIGAKSAVHQAGTGNSQYGTMWVYNVELKVSQRVPKSDDTEDGWKKGRVVDFSLLRPCKGCGELFHRESASFCTNECKSLHRERNKKLRKGSRIERIKSFSNTAVYGRRCEGEKIYRELGSVRAVLRKMGLADSGNNHVVLTQLLKESELIK